MSRYKERTEYASVRMVHLDVLELRAPGRQTMTVIGMDVQNGVGLPSDFCFPGLPSHVNRRVMENCLTYPGYTDAEPPSRRLSEEPVEIVNYERTSAANRATRIIEAEELKKQRAARADKLIEEEEKSKKKAVKKKVKKQKQRERKRWEKSEKEEPNTKNSNVKVTDSSQQPKGGESKGVNGNLRKDNANSSKDQLSISESLEESLYFTASDEDSEQEDSDSGTSEEWDMSCSFVSKAALIAKRKLEQKEKDKKKNPVKEETQLSKETEPPKETQPHKETQPPKEQSNEVQNHIKQNTLTHVSPRKMGFKDNIQTSTEFAVRGNKFASSGEYGLAVNYFTEAIKYNPTEYKLFGNRSFCFEKMQKFEKSLTDAEVSLTMCPGWVKGLYRKGRALAGLKRYEEAAKTFKEVLMLDSSCVDAAQELMRVHITQLMGYGFTREQSSNALIIHGTVEKALEVLSELHWRPGAIINGSHPSPPLPPAETNITRVSPVPLAATSPRPPPSQEEPKQSMSNTPLGPVHNKPNVQTRPNPNPVVKKGAVEPELFPIWVGNVGKDVTEDMVMDLFSRAGVVYSVKCLNYKRCAFVNFVHPNSCKGAIQQFDGYELMGITICVRYPDRTPRDMGISKTACTAGIQDDANKRECYFWRNIGCNRRGSCNYRHIEENYRIDFGKKRTDLEE